jgi:hypothetical protein
MSKRITDEERVVNFFAEAGLEKAQTLFNVVRGIMRSRTTEEGPQPVKTRKPRGKNKPKTTGSASTDTAVSAGAA